MNNSNMINPASYYNPFAKYNYVSKTRGVYIPRDAEPLLGSSALVEKSTSIYSENYDAENDVMLAMNNHTDEHDFNGKVLGFLNKFFQSED